MESSAPRIAFDITAGDFDNDGKLDLAASGCGGFVSVFRAIGGGAFAPRIDYPLPFDGIQIYSSIAKTRP